jgi:hypothetical protein
MKLHERSTHVTADASPLLSQLQAGNHVNHIQSLSIHSPGPERERVLILYYYKVTNYWNFYRKPSPDKPMFVEVGKSIAKGDTA